MKWDRCTDGCSVPLPAVRAAHRTGAAGDLVSELSGVRVGFRGAVPGAGRGGGLSAERGAPIIIKSRHPRMLSAEILIVGAISEA